MSQQTTSGVVLRIFPLTESSLVIHWLTADAGRISTVAKGARRPKSPFLGKIDLFFEAEISYTPSRRSDLHTLREIVLRNPHNALRHDLGWLQQASYCAALIEQTTETDSPLGAMPTLFAQLLEFLPTIPPAPATIFAFELRLLEELGLSPQATSPRFSPAAAPIIDRLRASPWELLPRLRLTAAQSTEIEQFLHGFLIYHFSRLARGRDVALHGCA